MLKPCILRGVLAFSYFETLGAIWKVWEASWGRLGCSWGRCWGPKKRPGGVLGRLDASKGTSSGVSWDTFGVQKAPWRHLESAQNHVFYKGFWHFRVLGIFARKNAALRALGGDLGGLGSLLGAPWGLLGASWGRPGASWGRLGGVLGRLGRVLGASWARLGAIFGAQKASWRPLGAYFLGRRLFCCPKAQKPCKNHSF